MERWYCFLAKGLKPLYGYGRLDQAFEFAQRLNRARGIIHSAKILTDEEAQELRLGDNTEAFWLTLALVEEDQAMRLRPLSPLARDSNHEQNTGQSVDGERPQNISIE